MSQPNRSRFLYWLNQLLFPLKMVIPQPIIAKIPGLTTNQTIRISVVADKVTGRLLDIGCGDNQLVQVYRQMGGEGLGVDVYPWQGTDLIVEDTSKLPYPDASFETVTFVACLNHIPNREAVLSEAYRLLSPDGQVILTNLTPVISRIWHAWAFWDKDQHERGMKEGEVWGFTTGELMNLLLRNGFEVINMTTFSWGLNQCYVCKRLADHTP